MKSSEKSNPTTLIEQQWVDIIARSFIKDMDMNPCVFQIPKSLKDSKPEAYTPQQLWLGPYSRFRFGPEFNEIESQKCTAVRKFLSKEHNLGFKDLVVDRMKVLEPTIRASYNKYLDFNGNTLAWIMAIDGLYLLQFLTTIYSNGEDQSLVMDIIKLENQIPTILLKEICKALKLHLQPSNTKNNLWLLKAFYQFCAEQSPLKLSEFQFDTDFDHTHLLDYMYQLIVNHQVKKESVSPPAANTDRKNKATSSLMSSGISKLIGKTRGAVYSTTTEITKIAANSAVVAQTAIDTAAAFGFKGAIVVQTNLKLLQKMHKMLPASMKLGQKSESEIDNNQAIPLLDHEIDIPTVSELCEISKIQFKISPGGIRDVEFDMDEKIFHLPVINLGSNSEVVLRNLVAYEMESAKAKPDSRFELASYVDLMCGIIDTAKDAFLLRKVGIIEGNLTDETVAEIFNGIKKSTGNSDNESKIEMVVKKVNEQWRNGGRHIKKKHARSSL